MRRLWLVVFLNALFVPGSLADQFSGITPSCSARTCFTSQQAKDNYALSHGCTWNSPTTGGGNGSTDSSSCPVPGSNSSTLSEAGNPIDVGTGNKLQIEHDFRDAVSDGLEFVRSYNSFQGAREVGMGRGWRHNWLRRIREDKSGLVTVFRPDGAHFIFPKESTYIAPPGVVDRLERTATGWRYVTGRGEDERYDAQGELQELRLSSGHTQVMQYSDDKRLVSVTDDRGRQIRFSYNGQHVNEVTLPSNEVLRFEYDASDRLVAMYRRPAGLLAMVTHWRSLPTTRYHYDDARFPDALTGLDDATGARYASWAYDRIGRAIMSQHGDGAEKITIEYRDETTVVITNAVGHAATYTLEPMGDGRRRVVAITGKAGNTCPQLRQRNHFDQNGFLELAADDDQQGRVMQRNQRGLIETEYDGVHIAADNNWSPAEDSLKITRVWHAQLPLVTAETSYRYRKGQWVAVQQASYTYDNYGNVQSATLADKLSSANPDDSPPTRRWLYARKFHDEAQSNVAVLRITDPLNNTTQLAYDPSGRLMSATNALGQVTRFSDYTAAQLPQRVVLPSGLSVLMQFDDGNRLTSIQRGEGEAAEITRIGYQDNGLATRLSLADGSEFQLTYNAARQLTAIRNARGEIQTFAPSKLNGDWLSRTTRDSVGRVVQQQRRRQDEWGRLLGWLGNSGQLTELAYNVAGDMVAASESHANPAAGGSARTTRLQYDTLHRLTELIDAAGNRTSVDYSASGEAEAISDANGNTTRYIRNGFGETLREINPARGDDTFRYDAMGNPIQRNQTHFTYDALNRVIAVDAPGEEGATHYTYDQTDTDHGDGMQQLTRVETPQQRIDYRYDAFGRRIQERTVDKNGNKYTHITTLKYDYLPGNRIEAITYPDGSVVHYRYDGDHIAAITYTDNSDPSKTEKPILKNIGYAPFGQPKEWTYGNDLREQIITDLDGRVQSVELLNSKTLWTQQYQYDLYSNIEKIERDGKAQQFDYDVLHRLTGEKSAIEATHYSYDPVGNRMEQTDNGKAIDYRYSAGNRLEKRGDVSLTLDGRGNLIEETQTDNGKITAQRKFDYNANNRPTNFYRNQQLTASYHYAANGLRDRKTVYNGNQQQTTRFAYAPDTRLLSASSETQTSQTIWLGNIPIAQIDKSKSQPARIAYIHTDHLLTPRVATNEQQRVVWRWHGDAFGDTKPEADPDKDGEIAKINLRFPGQYADEESWLYYNINRYYDPKLGRYITSDPIGLIGGMNGFAYVLADPIRYIDPTGLDVLITIDNRSYSSTGNSVSGTISVASDKTYLTFNGYTMENSHAGDNGDKGPIPEGVYDASVRADHDPNRVELVGVLGYENIQIHNGSYPNNFKGCFGAGTGQSTDFLTGTKDAMKQINKIIQQDGTGRITIYVGPIR